MSGRPVGSPGNPPFTTPRADMKIAVTGSIATDHLMHFPGKFSESLIADQLHKVSLSFLVDDLVVRRGGVASNIAFGMGQLGLNPILLGAVGADFADYDLNQIASFYAGAMSEARTIELAPVAARAGGLDLVLISANDPAAMIRHSQECRARGLAFAADPSQQLARMDGSDVLTLIRGAKYLLTNDYERSLLETKAGLTGDQVLDEVAVRITTLGKDGVEITGHGMERIHVPVARDVIPDDPTGVGDGFRAGFFAAISWGLGLERAAQVGSLVAALVLETVGPQEYEVRSDVFAKRIADSYGDEAAAEIRPFL